MLEELAHDPPSDDRKDAYSPQECFEAWDIVVQTALASSELFGIPGQPSLFESGSVGEAFISGRVKSYELLIMGLLP